MIKSKVSSLPEGIEQYNYFEKNINTSPEEYIEKIQSLIRPLPGVERTVVLQLNNVKNTDFKNIFTDIKPIRDKYKYVWIGLASCGFVTVVGKGTYNKNTGSIGDVFKDYSISKTAILISTIFKESKQLEDILIKINNFTQKVIIVPISTSASYTNLEKQIGKTLLDKNIPILNKNSHLR